MAENMKILLTTRNRYLEYGMRFLLKKDEVIVARDFLTPANRWYIPEYDTAWLIISDRDLFRLMCCIFHGRKFLPLNVESVRNTEDIRNAVHHRDWSHDTSGALTMSEMIVMFGCIFRELKPYRLAKEMGIHVKTVNSLLYSGMTKNGFRDKGVKSLASFLLTP
ncbi:hypothetical protein ACV2BG_004993 [Escherichia coli]|uniref:hypothetical protein n=1 Tax=Escherichia coli TaxID=562 RepID=UPI000DA59190|nr:hypothetical protein [Escherichia coli]MCO4916670.1 hypothetical protein [Escherichia coli]MCY6619632.1 hypothetical protein [Escherichia coli]MCY6738052.1 hypothetical protein [Escherichia coli]WGB18776.1 hypothetical protein NFL29_13760 [Escherichia coli]WGB79976.1 hypothetical protein NFL49_01865 [Escherichia coli]